MRSISKRAWSICFSARWIAAAIVLAGFVTTLIVNWPGHLEFDSIRQLIEGQTGAYSNWHPPIMSWMLGIANAIGPDAAPFIVLDAALSFGAILSLLWLTARPSWFVVAVVAVVVALPQLFLFQAIVWKDILFADACLAAFVCLAHAAVLWTQPPYRLLLISASVILAALAALTRQSGAVIVPVAALAIGAVAASGRDWRRGILYLTAYGATCAVLVLGINGLLQLRATKALGPIEQMEDLELYDIGGILEREPNLSLPVLARERPTLAERLKAKSTLYTPVGHDRLTDDPIIHAQITTSIGPVSRQWRALVLSNPVTYLSVRARDFSWLFLSTHPDECLTYAVGVISVPADLKRAGVKFRYDDRDQWLDESYAQPLLGTPALSHPLFAAIGLACFIFLIWRRRSADLPMAGLILATIVYTLSYFVIGIACQYRYLYLVDLSAIAALIYVAATSEADARIALVFSRMCTARSGGEAAKVTRDRTSAPE